jgi:hypothetical protein
MEWKGDAGVEKMVRMLLFPGLTFWYLGCLWALAVSIPAYYMATQKNRNPFAWAALCGLTALFLGLLSFAWLILLSTRQKLSMRMKYLSLKLEEQIAGALHLPSPIGNDLPKRILVILAYNPQGLRIGALAQAIGQNWRHIGSVVQRLETEGKIRKEDDRFFFNLE